jgi:predicted membrane protein (TIGR00267 family)
VAAFASGLAGMISMAAGSYLGSNAERDLHLAEIKKEALEIKEKPEEELAELIEVYIQEGFSREQAEEVANKIAQDKDLWLKTLAEKELGISIDATQERAPLKDALAMGVSFIIGAGLSVLPYVFVAPAYAIPVSIGLNLVLLFILGAVKSRVTRGNLWLSGLEVAGIGLLASLVGYFLGRLFPVQGM